ncbi:nucleotidyl transferase AbiEii/AbiGii toxin family protein [Isoptericola croceus]|uniref:nucleotidyl transferase AbiEii/AbiGii toxin family protein n=1 Tax=Isoptericola croceus TaxID=3031406 RepID=UPI0023F7A208|nr:nucleotidyl transferase AbiEii/AbiGii toxin family protein [Isoptericola croceus]
MTVPAPSLADLKAKTKPPASVSILTQWIGHAEKALGVPAAGGRMGWLVASTVVIAALQRAVDASGTPTFLLKGGTLLQHRLGKSARATSDLDGLVRGDIDEFIATLDDALEEPWGPLTLTRSEVEVIATPTRLLQPRRVRVFVSLKGQVWRKVQVELAPDEGGAGATPETVQAPTLDPFGIPTPDLLVTLAMRYQIAQKLHAVSDPHDPPTWINDRPRDVVDLLLLRNLVTAEATPTLTEIWQAGIAVFEARAADAGALDRPVRTWPPQVVAHPHWPNDYARAAADAGVTTTLDDAVAAVNEWISEIDASGHDT